MMRARQRRAPTLKRNVHKSFPYTEVIKLMEELVVLVGNFGFPVAVSMYLLVRLEGKLETLTESIHSLSEVLVTKR